MNDFVKVPAGEPIPLSILELDLPAPPIGWAAGLAEHGISIVFDDIGRRAISRADAKQLFDAQRQDQIRRRDHAARLEQAAVEQDQLRRANLPTGIPADPGGLAPVAAMVLAGESSAPRAKSVREQLLERELGSGESLVFHSFAPDEEV